MGLFDAIDIAGSGLAAERVRMDVTAENLANAQTTRTANGGPYQRQEVILQQVSGQGSFAGTLAGAMQPTGTEATSLEGTEGSGALQQSMPASAGGPAGGVQVAAIVADKTPDKLVYDPGNPEANAQGYVKMPNVDAVTEMADLIDESRSYQSDVTAMQTAKTMFNATLTILK